MATGRDTHSLESASSDDIRHTPQYILIINAGELISSATHIREFKPDADLVTDGTVIYFERQSDAKAVDGPTTIFKIYNQAQPITIYTKVHIPQQFARENMTQIKESLFSSIYNNPYAFISSVKVVDEFPIVNEVGVAYCPRSSIVDISDTAKSAKIHYRNPFDLHEYISTVEYIGTLSAATLQNYDLVTYILGADNRKAILDSMENIFRLNNTFYQEKRLKKYVLDFVVQLFVAMLSEKGQREWDKILKPIIEIQCLLDSIENSISEPTEDPQYNLLLKLIGCLLLAAALAWLTHFLLPTLVFQFIAASGVVTSIHAAVAVFGTVFLPAATKTVVDHYSNSARPQLHSDRSALQSHSIFSSAEVDTYAKNLVAAVKRAADSIEEAKPAAAQLR